jgi:hypothetical protein
MLFEREKERKKERERECLMRKKEKGERMFFGNE